MSTLRDASEVGSDALLSRRAATARHGIDRRAGAAARELVRLPPLERVGIEGFVLCDFEDLDRAGDWIRCPRGPGCPNQAFLTNVYASERLAHESLDRRARLASERILPAHPAALTRVEPLRFEIRCLVAEGFLGRDYRSTPCGMPHATQDLRNGHGNEPAWQEVRRQRDEECVEGVLLPGGPGVRAALFLFVSAAHCVRRLEPVAAVDWSDVTRPGT